MAEHSEESTVTEMIEEEPRKPVGSSSSSDSGSDGEEPVQSSSVKAKVYRLFGREKPVHQVLGGSKPADVMLWRDKKISAGALSAATAIWVLFELVGYHLLTFVCHGLILSVVILFLWSKACTFINKSPPRIPEVRVPEDQAVQVARTLRYEINRAFAVLREVALGRDVKKFLTVIAGLWLLSMVGSSVNFLTLVYVLFVTLHTVPVLYEKYEDKVDAAAEKAMAEIKKQYAVLDDKVLSKIPRGPLKDKKH
ncbi:hypothetical protein OPV22_023434 [Ensete ventricosum]|uniref:Reticulon-like protein n=1 Tax=Ensete ventricosum TaxID=4639 RepID=A0AAV8QVG4_ENSVE|nr:hypothetical protein OPV22_023434 [Ensete ventricosum]